MGLMIHDTTGTQTDCPKPLSRKKLRQLMPHNRPNLTARMLERSVGRLTADTRKRMRETEAEQKRERKLQLAGVPADARGMDSDGANTSVFKRLSDKFANMTEREQRKKAKG